MFIVIILAEESDALIGKISSIVGYFLIKSLTLKNIKKYPYSWVILVNSFCVHFMSFEINKSYQGLVYTWDVGNHLLGSIYLMVGYTRLVTIIMGKYFQHWDEKPSSKSTARK